MSVLSRVGRKKFWHGAEEIFAFPSDLKEKFQKNYFRNMWKCPIFKLENSYINCKLEQLSYPQRMTDWLLHYITLRSRPTWHFGTLLSSPWMQLLDSVNSTDVVSMHWFVLLTVTFFPLCLCLYVKSSFHRSRIRRERPPRVGGNLPPGPTATTWRCSEPSR